MAETPDRSMPSADFVARYREPLARHVEMPAEATLNEAYVLGRRALEASMSMLQLVELHLDARRTILGSAVAESLATFDIFLLEALGAFDISQRGVVQAQQRVEAEAARGALLRGLTTAYLAVASGATVKERTEEVCAQIKRLLDADDSRLILGHQLDANVLPDTPTIAAPLPGAVGTIMAIAAPGREWTEADRATLEQLAVLIHGPILDARTLEFSERLERVVALLSEAADPEAVVDRLLSDALDEIGTRSGVVLLRQDGALRVVGAGDEVPLIVGDELDLDDPSLLATVARTGRPLFLPDAAAIERYARDADVADWEARAESWALVPLPVSAGRSGVIGMRFSQPQPFDAVQRSFLTAVGDRLAAALERGAVLVRERTARQDAELAMARVDQLRELAADLSRATTRRGVGAAVLRYAVGMTDAVAGVVALQGRGSEAVELVTAVSAEGAGRWSVEDIPEDIVRAVADGESIEIVLDEDATPLAPDVAAHLRSRQIGALGTYPLSAGSRTIGGLVLGWTHRGVPAFDRRALRAAMAMAGPALRRARRYDVEHEIATTLQRSMLTVPEAVVPGIEWGVRYRSGSTGFAGGDWYDIIPLDDRRLGVAIGDIVGRGVQAAATMGQLRSTTRALAHLVADPGALLRALDDYTHTTGHGAYSTMTYVLVDREALTVNIASAGHPPLLLRAPDGTVTAIDAGRAALLGLDVARPAAELHVAAGSTLFLYTDGLVERRGEPIDTGIARLLTALSDAPKVDPNALCRHLMETMLGEDLATDDVAVVAVQFVDV